VTGTTVEPPTIISQPESQTVTAGTNVTLTVEAGGTDLTYQWQHNGTNIAGATDSSLSLTNVQQTDAGTYTVIVTNPGGSTTTDPIVLTVTDSARLPVILIAPQSQGVELGTDVVMSVVATNGTLTYQWRYYGHNIEGATSTSLFLTSVQFTNAGIFDVVVSNEYGSIVSPAATLSVRPWLSSHYADNQLTLTWPGPFTLQEAPECTGPYTDIISATVPYVVDVRLASRKFFRLAPIEFDLTITYLAGGEASLSVTGPQGLVFVIQASPDQQYWTDIHTNTAPATFVDVVPGQGVQRFYRVVPSWSMVSITPGTAPASAAPGQPDPAATRRTTTHELQ